MRLKPIPTVVIFLLLAAVIPAAAQEKETPAVTFEETTAAAGLVDGKEIVPDGPGVSLVDIDGDGDPDALVGSRLYFNEKGRFSRGPATGGPHVCFGDFDGDGDLDFLSGATAESGAKPRAAIHLYRNDRLRGGPPRWVDVTAESGIAGNGGPKGMAWLDFDGDDILDIYIGNYETPWGADGYRFLGDRLFRGLGGGKFEDVTEKTGLLTTPRPAIGAAPCDFDFDGDTDIYVTNYRLTDNFLWRNNGDGTFSDAAVELEVEGGRVAHSNGAHWFDCDNDGDADLFVVNLKHNIAGQQPTVLYRNNGDGSFTNITDAAGLRRKPDAGYPDEIDQINAAVGDFDNDGRLDLFITESCQGGTNSSDIPPPYRVAGGESRLYRNRGDGTFEEIRSDILNRPDTWGAAAGDYDGDGRLDILVGSGNWRCPPIGDVDFEWFDPGASRVALLRNTTLKAGAWVKVRLESRSCPLPGTRVVVVTEKGKRFTRFISGGYGAYTAANTILHFGLGRDRPERVEIYWPDGSFQKLLKVRLNKLLTVAYRRGNDTWIPKGSKK
jgi:enediyne biosynthesis protein E4